MPTAIADKPAAATKPVTTRRTKVTCADCFFRKNDLCALEPPEPCPTFRHHEQGLKPPRQLSLVYRQARTRSAWVFGEST